MAVGAEMSSNRDRESASAAWDVHQDGRMNWLWLRPRGGGKSLPTVATGGLCQMMKMNVMIMMMMNLQIK